MPNYHCSYGGCTSNSRVGSRSYDPAVKFYRFPQPCFLLRDNVLTWSKTYEESHIKNCIECTICSNWMLSCKRSDYRFMSVRQISRHVFICSRHFPDRPAKIDYVTTLPTDPPITECAERRRSHIASRSKKLMSNERLTSETPSIVENVGDHCDFCRARRIKATLNGLSSFSISSVQSLVESNETEMKSGSETQEHERRQRRILEVESKFPLAAKTESRVAGSVFRASVKVPCKGSRTSTKLRVGNVNDNKGDVKEKKLVRVEQSEVIVVDSPSPPPDDLGPKGCLPCGVIFRREHNYELHMKRFPGHEQLSETTFPDVALEKIELLDGVRSGVKRKFIQHQQTEGSGLQQKLTVLKHTGGSGLLRIPVQRPPIDNSVILVSSDPRFLETSSPDCVLGTRGLPNELADDSLEPKECQSSLTSMEKPEGTSAAEAAITAVEQLEPLRVPEGIDISDVDTDFRKKNQVHESDEVKKLNASGAVVGCGDRTDRSTHQKSLAKPTDLKGLHQSCRVCFSRFSSFPLLKEHFLKEHPDAGGPICCGKCPAAFFDGDSAKEHHSREHPPSKVETNLYNCDKCPARFETSLAVKEHKLQLHSEKTILPAWVGCRNLIKRQPCGECGAMFFTPITREEHRKSQHPESYGKEAERTCNECDARFTDPDALGWHLRRHHVNPELRPPLKCPFCRHAVSTEDALEAHAILHDPQKPHECPECNHKAKNRPSLLYHMKSKHTKKRFSCADCDFKTHRKYFLDLHSRTHTGEKPYLCDICGQPFAHRGTLVVHRRTHNDERPFSCDLCDYKARSKCRMVVHMRKHTGERPYRCPYCDFGAINTSNLKAHIRVHHKDVHKGVQGRFEDVDEHSYAGLMVTGDDIETNIEVEMLEKKLENAKERDSRGSEKDVCQGQPDDAYGSLQLHDLEEELDEDDSDLCSRWRRRQGDDSDYEPSKD